MRLEQLEYLIEVSRTNSITLAGEQLHVAQQSISKSLKNLEIELGAELFIRTSKGIYLTVSGEKTVENAFLILEHVEQLKNDILPVSRIARRNLTGKLSICSTPCFFTALAPKLIADFNSIYAKIAVTHQEVALDQVYEDIICLKQDIGFISLEWQRDNHYAIPKELTFNVVQKDFPYAIMNKMIPMAQNKTISLNKLKNFPLMIYKPELTNHQPFYQKLFESENAYTFIKTDNLLASCQEIISGHCIGFSSKIAQQHTLLTNNDNLVAIPIRDGIKMAVGYLLNNQAPFNRITELFIQQFKDLCCVK